MPGLEIFDTVVLKSDRYLVGTVERTHYVSHEPLEDCLIIAHSQVDSEILHSFLSTGKPPKHHVFVQFSDQRHGSCLVHENDVELLDRTFTIGDVVKRADSQIKGTVVDVSEAFTLEPVWRCAESQTDAGLYEVWPVDQTDGARSRSRPALHQCDLNCPKAGTAHIEHHSPHTLISHVPGRELKRRADLVQGDLVVKNEWLGAVEDVSLIVTLRLENESIVVVHDAEELYIPVPDRGKTFISFPDLDSGIRPHGFVVAQQGHSDTIPLPTHEFQSGQFVITNHRNLRDGRFLRGSYNSKIPATGHIIDVRTSVATVRWVTANPYGSEEDPVPPDLEVSVYENIGVFPSRSELRRNKKLTILDMTRYPQSVHDRRRTKLQHEPNSLVNTATEIRVGDYVKFRDQAGAAVKYRGELSLDSTPHGRFDRIPANALPGFDLNELRVTASHQDAKILWQDGGLTTHASQTLIQSTSFESDLTPTDLVVAREGMLQRSCADYGAPDAPWTPFNEMAVFEQMHELKPRRAGVVQSVDTQERIARVRWFDSPVLRLKGNGNILAGESRFGPLSETLEDISLYEIMTFPALMPRLKDLALLRPGNPSSKALDSVQRAEALSELDPGCSPLSAVSFRDRIYWLRSTAYQIGKDVVPQTGHDCRSTPSHPDLDWVGEIVRLGLDGTVTVRVCSVGTQVDVLVEYDQIISFLDEQVFSPDAGDDIDDRMSMDDSYSGEESSYGSESESIISEVVEYEGGERMDDDSGDDDWEDDGEGLTPEGDHEQSISERQVLRAETEDAAGRVSNEGNSAMAHTDGEASSGGLATTNELHPENVRVSLNQLRAALPVSIPASFAVLDLEPPPDQYGSRESSLTSAMFVKRVMKEHRILSSSLPQGEIYVRTYESRLDCLRCLIIGPKDTPYEYAPFLIDLYLGPNFPREPPTAHFHSWTGGLGRINPNLYEEGKICLSLLGTWQGQHETESWSPKATILQLLVSLQGLVFVKNPYYNEAGFEGYEEEGSYKLEAQTYTEKSFVMARSFVKHALLDPVIALEDVLAWSYLPHLDSPGLLNTVVERGKRLIEASRSSSADQKEREVDGAGSSEDTTTTFMTLLSRGAIIMLEKSIHALDELMHSDGACI